MALLRVNGYPQSINEIPRTVGDLLDDVEREADAAGRLLTAVRIDGVEEPDFRASTVAERPLRDVRVVEVSSGSGRELVAQCLEDAAAGLITLAGAATDAARQYRDGDLAEANATLAAVTQGLATALAVVETSSVALQRAGVVVADPVGSLIDETAARVSALIDAETAADWQEVADLLAYDLAPSVEQWVRICHTLREAALA